MTYYHILIEIIKNKKSEFPLLKDLENIEEIKNDYLIPYLNKEEFHFNGYLIKPKNIEMFLIKKSANKFSYYEKLAYNRVSPGMVVIFSPKSVLTASNLEDMEDITSSLVKEVKNSYNQLTTENKIKGVKNMNPEQVQKIELFISHSSADENLAKQLISLIKDTIKFETKEIRCTSVDGYKLPPGHTSSMLKKELEECSIVIGLITESSIKSNYVNFELGVGWYLDKAWAILDTNINYNQIPGPLSEHNAIKLNDSGDISSLLDNIIEKTQKKHESISIINSKIKDFLNSLPDSKKKL
jgi:hypothetical protein